MSNQNPLSPFDPHSDLPEAGQSPWPQGQYGDPGYGTTQYGDPGYGTTQYGDPGYGTTQYGDPGYGTTQYGAPSYGTDPAAVSYQQVSPTIVGNRQQRRRSLKFVFVMLATILLGCAVYFLRDLFDYGTPLLMLRLAESAVGLVLALSCFPFGSILQRQAQPSGRTPQRQRDMSGPLYYGMVSLLIAGVSLYYGVPAAMDLADGPTPRTVTSCMYFQYDGPRSMFSSSPVYKDNFLINFEGGLTHTTTFISENIDDIATRGDLATELYNTCEHRERGQTMTVSYYPRTWILADVQVSGS